jgi:hypothetical protein
MKIEEAVREDLTLKPSGERKVLHGCVMPHFSKVTESMPPLKPLAHKPTDGFIYSDDVSLAREKMSGALQTSVYIQQVNALFRG